MMARMDWAVDLTGTLQNIEGEKNLKEAFGEDADENDKVERLKDKEHQIYSILMNLTEGEANDIVCNSGRKGVEEWRELARRYDPLVGGRIRNLLGYIINTGRCPLADLQGALERWEEQINKYCTSKDMSGKNRELPEDIKMAALEHHEVHGLPDDAYTGDQICGSTDRMKNSRS